MTPQIADAHIEVSPLRAPRDPWRDASGEWWTPGTVNPEGLIVSATAAQFIADGVVWIALDQLAEAERHGWTSSGVAHAGLVQVARAPDGTGWTGGPTYFGLYPGDPDDRGMAARILDKS